VASAGSGSVGATGTGFGNGAIGAMAGSMFRVTAASITP
jgi:hypothetical protein